MMYKWSTFRYYQILQRHRTVSLPKHGFLAGLFLQTEVIHLSTRSSATAEKQRVSCPHGGGLRPQPTLPTLATPMHMVESETRNKLTSSVPSTKRTLR